MIVEAVAGAVAVIVVVSAAVLRRGARGDVHSVEGYHRSIHTLEHINDHAAPGPSGSAAAPGTGTSTPTPHGLAALGHGMAGADQVHPQAPAGSRSVRVIERPAPLVALSTDTEAPNAPAHDAATTVESPASGPADQAVSASGVPVPSFAHRDRAMSAITHPRRRIAGPAGAVAAVTVLIVVLLVTGSHTVAPTHHHQGGAHHPSGTHHGRTAGDTGTSTPTSVPTRTTQLPPVSLPQSATVQAATYDVTPTSYTVTLHAGSGPCWVDLTNGSTGAVLFAGTLSPGMQQSLPATGSVTLVLGAPAGVAIALNGQPVQLPTGFHTPFTLHFVPVGASAT